MYRSPACAHCGATDGLDICPVCERPVCAACRGTSSRNLAVESASATVIATYGFGHNDDRVFLDEKVQLYAIADASGPTYGGYHEPTGVEPGWRAMRRAWDAGRPGAGRTRMRHAIAAANEAMFDPAWPAGSLSHPAASFTTIGFSRGHIMVGQVGTCRCYRLRGTSLELLLDDHSLATQAQRSGADVPEHHRDVATRLLGMAAEVEGAFCVEAVQAGDLFVLCTDGLWLAVPEDHLLDVCGRRGELAEIADALLRRLPAEHHGDATVCLLRASSP